MEWSVVSIGVPVKANSFAFGSAPRMRIPIEALLRAMRLVDQRDDVVALGEHRRLLVELLDRGDDHAARIGGQQRAAAAPASSPASLP